MHFHPTQVRRGSVCQDWRRPLPDEKSQAYLGNVRRLEIAYAMFSVNLDESFGLRRAGRTAKAYQTLRVAPALCRRLASPLHSLLCAMLEHCKHFGTTPNLAPLDPANFQNPRSQRVARFNDLVSTVLLTRKSQFLHKISALAELVDELGRSFETTVDELEDGVSNQPERDWELLDSVHYDLNTCLREGVVILKSFLHALPEGQLTAFQASLEAHLNPALAPLSVRARHLAHRRIALLKGQ